MEVTSNEMFQFLLLCMVVAAASVVVEQVARILRAITTFGIVVMLIYLAVSALLGM